MKASRTGSDSIRIEMTRSELASLRDVLYTSSICFDRLDTIPYQITKDEVSELANSLDRISNDLVG